MEWKFVQGMVVKCEDEMYRNRVFVNAVSGELSHMEVYNTVIDHKALKDVLADLFPRFSDELWGDAADYWGREGGYQFLARVLALAVRRYRLRYLQNPNGDLHQPLPSEQK